MLLGLLFSILSVTYIIETSSSVSTSGTPPADSEAIYSRTGTTGQVGQMTAGNSTLLTLNGWDGIELDSVVLQMRSNKSAGAGSLTMRIGDATVWTINDADFSHKTWHGSFTNEWTTISRWIGEKVPKDQAINILIEASKNSLYVKSYTLYYTLPEPEAYTVTYVTGIGLEIPNSSEEYPLAGVVLPAWKDTLNWRFLGWSEVEAIDSDTCPTLLQAGDTYYPIANCKLWAIYSDDMQQDAITNYVSGKYAVASSYWSRAMRGATKNGMINTCDIALTNENGTIELLTSVDKAMTYQFRFLADSTLTIQHVATGEWIGYAANTLCNAEKKWHYRVLSDGSLCVHHGDGILFWGYGADAQQKDIVVYDADLEWSLMQTDGLLLFPAKKMYFTTWPFGKIDGVENIIIPEFIEENTEYILHLGSHELHIQNGKKWLRLQ